MTPKQEKFISEYLVDGNGTKAAGRAGYKGTDRILQAIASENLSKPMIRQAVDAGLAKQKAEIERRATANVITKERWLDELQAMGLSDTTNLFAANEKGQLAMSLQDIKARGLGRLIREMTVAPDGKVRIKLHSKLPALELIAKHFGWVKEHVEHSGQIGNPIQGKDVEKIFDNPEMQKHARQLALAMTQTGPAKPAKGGSGGKGN